MDTRGGGGSLGWGPSPNKQKVRILGIKSFVRAEICPLLSTHTIARTAKLSLPNTLKYSSAYTEEDLPTAHNPDHCKKQTCRQKQLHAPLFIGLTGTPSYWALFVLFGQFWFCLLPFVCLFARFFLSLTIFLLFICVHVCVCLVVTFV